jgi:hypothetical protein
MFGWLVASCVLVLVGSYAWVHRNHLAAAVAVPATEAAPSIIPSNYEEAQKARQAAPIAGPLAQYMSHQKASDIETLDPVPPTQAISYKPTASDHVGGSVVGTSNEILHQTFGVAKVVRLAFEVPAHASNPQLRGTYRSFVKPGSAPSSDADVEFLVLNEPQFGDFLNGHGSEAVFSAEDSHEQEVTASLPPTINQPVTYYLIFRNNSHTAGKKLVQADFRVDF